MMFSRDVSRARARFGTAREASRAMMATTIINSTKVNPERPLELQLVFIRHTSHVSLSKSQAKGTEAANR